MLGQVVASVVVTVNNTAPRLDVSGSIVDVSYLEPFAVGLLVTPFCPNMLVI